MKKRKNIIGVVIILLLSIGVTISYLQSTDAFENIFNAGTYKTVTHEEFTSPDNWKPGDTTPKTITTTNQGTIPVRVRVKLDEIWKNFNDEELPLEFSGLKKVSIINLDNEIDWIYKEGYYYYLHELAPGEETTSPIKSVTFNPEYNGNVSCNYNSTTNSNECSSSDEYMGGTYTLNITTETVQSDAYETLWEDIPLNYDYVGDNPCTFAGELVPGAEYVNGQYTYRYRQEWYRYDNVWINTPDIGWGVRLTDNNSTEPVTSPLCSSINNKPIISMNGIFSTSKTTSIDFSVFDTSNVTNMREMFLDSKVTSLDLGSFNTSNVTDMVGMFYKINVPSLDLSSFDTSNVIDMTGMFQKANIQSLNIKGFDTSNVIDMHGMFLESQINTLIRDDLNTAKVTNMNMMFAHSSFENLNLTDFNTSRVTNMAWMFWGSAATSIDVSSFDTSNVTTMQRMFSYSNATSLNLENFDTSNVTNMKGMFQGNYATELKISSFNTHNVTNMYSMFEKSKATTLDLSSFDTSNVTDIRNMFKDASATTGYAKTQTDADKFNTSSDKPSTLTFVVKNS